MNRLIKTLALAICCFGVVAGCASDDSSVDVGSDSQTTTSQAPPAEATTDDDATLSETDDASTRDETMNSEDDAFTVLREFLDARGRGTELLTELAATTEDGRGLRFGVWQQSDGTDAYTLGFVYEPSCSSVEGVLTPHTDGTDAFSWTRGRPLDGGFDHEDKLCAHEWSFEPALTGYVQRADLSIVEVGPSSLTIMIDGLTETWIVASLDW